MPEHIHYVEPYAGGLAVLLAKNPEGVSEVVNDISRDLTNFWKVLQGGISFATLIRLCQATPFGELEWTDTDPLFHPDFGDDSPMQDQAAVRAWRFFIRCRQSLSGRMKSFTGITKKRLRRGMNNEVSAWLSAIEGLPMVHERLKRVLILNRPALDVIRSQDGPETCFYCDPPYLHETRVTTKDYEHEMTVEDHLKMLQVLREVKGKFLLSGYRSQLYDEFAHSAGWHRTDWSISNHAAGGKKKRKMTESLWANFPLKEST